MTFFRRNITILSACLLLGLPCVVAAQETGTVAHQALATIYARRLDLQTLFRPSDWKAIPSPKTSGLTNLEDWARLYGYQEHAELALFHAATTSPAVVVAPIVKEVVVVTPDKTIITLPPALLPIKGAPQPVPNTIGATFDFSTITAEKILVVDPTSRRIILAKGADKQHHLASLTKLMTALLVSKRGLVMDEIQTVLAEDEVGGARLRVTDGTPLTVRDIFYAMIVGSANNAAHALARLTGKSLPTFVADMNAQAKNLGLASTTFADPSGLELGNVSNAQDIAALALIAFDDPVIRRAATTASYPLVAEGQTRQMKNTNGLLTDPSNGLYVLGGKTGYLVESKWNLVVKMMDARKQPLLVVTLGSASKPDSFKDSARVARWVWDHYQWVK